jgi:uncharacterized protein YcgI (DUF1989 family)
VQALYGRVAIASRTIAPGEAASFELAQDQMLQIVTPSGRQVAEVVGFRAGSPDERISPATTRTKNKSIMLELGKKLYSTRFQPLLEVTSDSVGRHDMLFSTTEPVKPVGHEQDGDEEPTHQLVEALADYGVTLDAIAETVNFFANISIKSKGELSIDESLAEANDSVTLKALADVVVAVGNRKGLAGTGIEASPLVVRVFR